MTRIVQVIAVPVFAAGYYEDRAALDVEHVPLPQRFTAAPVTPGFRALREPAEAVSVGLVLDTGQVVWGDCSAPPGRGRPVFRDTDGVRTLRGVVAPHLEGRQVTTFREMAREVSALVETVEIERPVVREKEDREGVSRRALFTAPVRALESAREERATQRVLIEHPLHPAIRFGVGQALLRATALNRRVAPADVVAAEWDLPAPAALVPVHAHAGHDWHYDAERMIVHRAASLPGGQVDHVEQQVGSGGAELSRYLRWLAGRIQELAGDEYRPAIHIDLRGALGKTQHGHVGHMLGQLYTWQIAATPYTLRVQDPVLWDDRATQIARLAELREGIRLRRLTVEIAAGAGVRSLDDVQAFTRAGAADLIHIRLPVLGDLDAAVEATLACRAADTRVLLDGGVAGTELAAHAAAQLALATRPDLVAAGPGTGVDEGISLVRNEMARALVSSGSRMSTDS